METLGATFDKPQWAGYARLQEVFRQASKVQHVARLRLESIWKVALFADDKKQSPRTRCLLKEGGWSYREDWDSCLDRIS